MHRVGPVLARALSPLHVGEIGGRMPVNYECPTSARISHTTVRRGEMLARLGQRPAGLERGQFMSPHGLAVDSRGDIYVGEVSYTTGASLQDQAPPPVFAVSRSSSRCADAWRSYD